jgi:hypothetical protein
MFRMNLSNESTQLPSAVGQSRIPALHPRCAQNRDHGQSELKDRREATDILERNGKQGRYLNLLVLILFWSSFGGLCGTLQPAANPDHPWAAQPLQPATKEYFCRQLGLANDHPICQPNRDVFAADLVPVLEERFPVNQTPFSEVAAILKGYPVQAEESKLPDGTVTSKRYAYLLTEYDGFCVYFSIRDVQSDIVARISSTSIGSGPTRDTCTSSEVRAQPRPWQLK